MPGPLSTLLARRRGVQHALLLALVLVPVLIVTVAFVPALLVLPFLPSRAPQVRGLVAQLDTWTRALLLGSREG